MHPNPRLHHFAQNITRGHLENVIEMYSLLHCEVVFRPPVGQTWAMIGQMQLRFAIQIVEVEELPIGDIKQKRRTHVAFMSDNPAAIISEIEQWAIRKGLEFQKGSWSDKELYFDLPSVFVNFVVEVFHASLEEE